MTRGEAPQHLPEASPIATTPLDRLGLGFSRDFDLNGGASQKCLVAAHTDSSNPKLPDKLRTDTKITLK